MKTLDELKAMSDKELVRLWDYAEFPFEALSCGTCMTGHHHRYGGCHSTAHAVLSERISAMGAFDIDGLVNQRNIEEFVALRLFYDDQYAPAKRVGSHVAQRVKETVNG